MTPGMTLRGSDGKQVFLYPLPVLNITQVGGPGSFSHCCGYPLDVVGTGSKATMYAPCDCHVTWEGTYANGHPVIFVSDNKVHTPSGLTYVSFLFGHGDLLGNKSTYKQGEPIYTTGVYGNVTGDHCHLETSNKPNAAYINSGIVCSFGNQCYMIDGSINPVQAFYINGTKIINTQGLSFKTFTGGTGGTGGACEVLDWIIPVHPDEPFERSLTYSEEDEKNNAKCFYGYMHLVHGWTLNSICGMLGNIHFESSCNPNTWQGLYKYTNPANLEGFGLVQWTPYTNITDWLEKNGYWGKFELYGKAECDKIEEELQTDAQWAATPSYPISFEEFKNSTQSPHYLAGAFLYNYERAQLLQADMRGEEAERWYAYLKDWDPVIPGECSGARKKEKKFWMYNRPVWKMI